ncbi:MAG: hydrogenase formation protein HypD [Bryobacteraceae bacterium]
MKYLDEYRRPDAVHRVAAEIARLTTRPWTLMEVCGGQTHSIVKNGLLELLPETIELLHGPGCPVCVTPAQRLNEAIELARRPEVILCSFGDMLRVPGSSGSLLAAKAAGADVRMVYSPLDALALACANPTREIVFFAVGFETTAPATAMAVLQAHARNIPNFSLLVAHVLVPPALEAIAAAPDCRVDAFLAAGHVCAVMGFAEYRPLASRLRKPIVVTGFEPLDILDGVRIAVRQLEEGRCDVVNQYSRAVLPEGNLHARAALDEAFEVGPQSWRGIGDIPRSGLRLKESYARFDAARRFFSGEPSRKPSAESLALAEGVECIAGDVLRGRRKPFDCPSFGHACNPDRPLGAPMVSSEGACAAYYRYAKLTSQ